MFQRESKEIGKTFAISLLPETDDYVNLFIQLFYKKINYNFFNKKKKEFLISNLQKVL